VQYAIFFENQVIHACFSVWMCCLFKQNAYEKICIETYMHVSQC
jgi:hypothetical protein